MPEMEMWTINHEARLPVPASGSTASRSTGAPGDRVTTTELCGSIIPPSAASILTDIYGRRRRNSWYRTSSLKFSGEGPA